MTSFYIPLRDPIARHARPLIAMLEERIRDEFGLDVKIAFEKELTLTFDKKTGARLICDEIGATIQGHRESQRYMIEHKMRREIPPVMAKFEHEHDIDLFEFQTEPTTPLRAVTRIDGQCQLIERYSAEYRAAAGKDEKREDLMPLIAKIRDRFGIRFKDVDFKPHHTVTVEGKRSDTTSGLHVNVSLWDRKRHNLMNAGNRVETDLMDKITRKLYEYTKSDLLLIAPDEEAVKRLQNLKPEDPFCHLRNPADTKRMNDKRISNPDHSRMEFRRPSANARHDLSALMAMAALYQALKSDPHKKYAEIGVLQPPESFDAVKQSFEQSSRLIADLREITGSEGAMRAHVDQLRHVVIDAARKHSLHQPGLMELRRGGAQGRA